MHLQKLELQHFKNYEYLNLEFSPLVNCLVGANGAGKTNVLDAIYYLSFCKGYFNYSDRHNLSHKEAFFTIKGHYDRLEEALSIYCGYKKGEKKIFKKNTKTYTRLIDHIGLVPLVFVSPADHKIIEDHSEIRRKFVDGILCQTDSEYLHALVSYNKGLNQRNALLKKINEGFPLDKELIDSWDMQLIDHGVFIYERRKAFMEAFKPHILKFYEEISSQKEQIDVLYQSHLDDKGFEELLKESLRTDIQRQFTSKGIHKDDWTFEMENVSLKKYGSQGQQKSFIIALKLAQLFYIKESLSIAPILLLDDIFDKLDKNRVEALIGLVSKYVFGSQIFITDTDQERMQNLLENIVDDYRLFEVVNGKINVLNGVLNEEEG